MKQKLLSALLALWFCECQMCHAAEPPKSQPVPIASYSPADRVAQKRVREVLQANGIESFSTQSASVSVHVSKEKVARAKSLLRKLIENEGLKVKID